MTGIWLCIIGSLLMIFGITLSEVIAGIFILVAGITFFALKFNLLDSFINSF